MYIKNAKLYFNKNDCVSFRNVEFIVSNQKNYDFTINQHDKHAIIFSIDYDNFISSYKMTIKFDYLYNRTTTTSIMKPCIDNKQQYKLLLLYIILKMSKIIYNVFVQFLKYKNENIIIDKLSRKINIYMCIKNDGGPNLVMKSSGGDMYIHINNTDFNNIDNIHYDNIMFIIKTRSSYHANKIILENNILRSGYLIIIFPKSYKIDNKLEAQITRDVDFYIKCNESDAINSYFTVQFDYVPIQHSQFIYNWFNYVCIDYRVPISLLINYIKNINYIDNIENLRIYNEYDILKYL